MPDFINFNSTIVQVLLVVLSIIGIVALVFLLVRFMLRDRLK